MKTEIRGIKNLDSPRKQIININRIRTGHCRLNKYMYRIKKMDSPMCSCGEKEETFEHLINECELTKVERERIYKCLDKLKIERPYSIETILSNPTT